MALLSRREAPRAVRLMRDHIEGTEHILAGLLPPVAPPAPAPVVQELVAHPEVDLRRRARVGSARS